MVHCALPRKEKFRGIESFGMNAQIVPRLVGQQNLPGGAILRVHEHQAAISSANGRHRQPEGFTKAHAGVQENSPQREHVFTIASGQQRLFEAPLFAIKQTTITPWPPLRKNTSTLRDQISNRIHKVLRPVRPGVAENG